MIYTITLNPAIDRSLEVRDVELDHVNRVDNESRYAGGKGIDVSRALRELGWESVALGFIGGYTGHEVAGRLGEEGVMCRFTPIANETRTNIIVHDQASGEVTSFNARGPEVSTGELDSFLNHLDYLYPPPSFIACSGSVPPGVPSQIYQMLIEWARPRNIKVVLDADGAPMKMGVKAVPFAIKPNLRELGNLVEKKVSLVEEVLASARELHAAGISVVLVSLGEEGLVGVSGEGAYHAIPPKVEVLSPVGAGDSTVAGFLISQVEGFSLEKSVRLASAAGTAAVLTSGTELCRREDVDRIEPLVKVRRLG